MLAPPRDAQPRSLPRDADRANSWQAACRLVLLEAVRSAQDPAGAEEADGRRPSLWAAEAAFLAQQAGLRQAYVTHQSHLAVRALAALPLEDALARWRPDATRLRTVLTLLGSVVGPDHPAVREWLQALGGLAERLTLDAYAMEEQLAQLEAEFTSASPELATTRRTDSTQPIPSPHDRDLQTARQAGAHAADMACAAQAAGRAGITGTALAQAWRAAAKAWRTASGHWEDQGDPDRAALALGYARHCLEQANRAADTPAAQDPELNRLTTQLATNAQQTTWAADRLDTPDPLAAPFLVEPLAKRRLAWQ
jgi:hypothetical protein